ncbi:MAG: tetratricopeptide repeat protein [Bacteroidales bacterium]|nr:tetratricopeptide repeat protein [Bacteroidales bacterium]
MKKITFLAVLFLSITMMASAQKNTRTTAYNYLRKGKFDLAKENIDKAVGHEKTMNDAKTWFYYGNIYIQIATTQDSLYADLDAEALDKAYKGYSKCKELDTKNTYLARVLQDMIVIANNYYSRGLILYQSEDYANAYIEFNEAIKVNLTFDNVDTLAIYATAMSASSAEMQDEAIKSYEELVEMDYDNASIYSDLASIYKKKKDIESAKITLKKGMERYPEHAGILIAMINILMEEGKNELVIESLESAIKLTPENHTLYFVQGVSYEQIGDTEKAIASYQEAIEVNPSFADAYYNLGVLEYTKASDIYTTANDLPLDAAEEYDKLTNDAKVFLLNAQPYLEQVLEIGSEDEVMISGCMMSLKEIYKRTNQLEKITELNNR